MSPSAPRLRPVLAPDHVALVSALARCAELQRRVVARTPRRPPGEHVALGRRRLRVEAGIGEGMMAVTYAAADPATDEPFALKQARAPVGLLRQVLRLEDEASRRLPEWSGLRTARVVDRGADALAKELYRGPTLAALAIDDAVTVDQRRALEDVLARGRTLLEERGFLADLSPKNLVWEDGGWLLLDTAQPLFATAFAAEVLARDPSWTRYMAYHGPRLGSRRSRPSALTPGAGPGDYDPRAATRRAFLRGWWTWLPCDDAALASRVLAHVDPDATAEEVVYVARAAAGTWRLEPGPGAPDRDDDDARARALEEWARLYPEDPAPAGP